jgi:DUF1980 C-terminal domain
METHPESPHPHRHGPECGHTHDHESVDGNEHPTDEHVASLDRRFFHWVSCLLLLLWGGVLVYYFASGRIVHYLTGSGAFQIQCLLGGLALCVLGAFNLLTSTRRSPHDDEHAADHCCGRDTADHAHAGNDTSATSADEPHEHADEHDHESEHSPARDGGGWLSKCVAFAILAVPLTAAAVYSPDRYSDSFKANLANATLASRPRATGGGAIDLAKRAAQVEPVAQKKEDEAKPPLKPNAFTVAELESLSGGRSPEGHIRLQLVELFYLPAQTEDVKEVAASVTIETIGQAIKDKTDPTKLRLFRLMMTCCAADARPISMPIEFDGPAPDWREMSWYKAVGKVEYREIDGTPTTVFKATSLTPEKPPRNQMMY